MATFVKIEVQKTEMRTDSKNIKLKPETNESIVCYYKI